MPSIRYHAFGQVLESPVPFAELHAADPGATPTWRLQLVEGDPPALRDPERIGEEPIAYGATVRLDRDADRTFRLTYSDTGTFDVDPSDGAIRWWRPPACDHDLATLDILGRVLATMLHAQGVVTLHASAVAIGGAVVGFMAPKFTGKSTLAAALTYAGARLVSDDALAILPGVPVRCVPGVPSVRLRQESAAHFPATRDLRAPDLPRWRIVDTLAADRVARAPLPLAALYVLSPAPGQAVPATRVPMGSIEAIVALSHFAKMGALLGDREGRHHVTRVVEVIGAIPVFTLSLVRDLGRLDEVVRALFDWHAPGGA